MCTFFFSYATSSLDREMTYLPTCRACMSIRELDRSNGIRDFVDGQVFMRMHVHPHVPSVSLRTLDLCWYNIRASRSRPQKPQASRWPACHLLSGSMDLIIPDENDEQKKSESGT
jgi:hypothetical protein